MVSVFQEETKPRGKRKWLWALYIIPSCVYSSLSEQVNSLEITP